MRKLHAGLDVSLEMTSVCVVDEDGATVPEAKAPSDPEAFAEALQSVDGVFERIGLEADPRSSWRVSKSKATGLPAIGVEARHARAAMVAMTRNKNDRDDARSLAHLIRSGWFKAVHVKPVESQEPGRLPTVREFFVSELDTRKNLPIGVPL